MPTVFKNILFSNNYSFLLVNNQFQLSNIGSTILFKLFLLRIKILGYLSHKNITGQLDMELLLG